jgi:hypothetical protein
MTGLSLPDEAGHFMLILQRAPLPRFASDNRMSGTAEENKAVVQGSIAYFGRHRPGQRHDLPTLRWQHLPELGWRYARTTGVRFRQRGQLLGNGQVATDSRFRPPRKPSAEGSPRGGFAGPLLRLVARLERGNQDLAPPIRNLRQAGEARIGGRSLSLTGVVRYDNLIGRRPRRATRR